MKLFLQDSLKEKILNSKSIVYETYGMTSFNDDSIFSHSTWAEGDEGNSSNGYTYL